MIDSRRTYLEMTGVLQDLDLDNLSVILNILSSRKMRYHIARSAWSSLRIKFRIPFDLGKQSNGRESDEVGIAEEG
jgi:hypothetical protein